MAAARCAGARSPRRNPSRLNIPVGRLDHRAFWGLSKGNWTLVRPTSSSVARKACAEATIRVVASAAAVCAGGDGLRGAARLAPTTTNLVMGSLVRLVKPWTASIARIALLTIGNSSGHEGSLVFR